MREVVAASNLDDEEAVDNPRWYDPREPTRKEASIIYLVNVT